MKLDHKKNDGYFKIMSTILDYITWRGDLSLDIVPFNEIDALIFCEFAYLKLQDIVPSSFDSTSISLRDAAALFFTAPDVEARSDIGLLFGDTVVELFKLMAATERYGSLQLCGFVEHLDVIHEKQFAAVTVKLGDGTFFVVFRGTDDSLVGWKEDFNMCFMTPVPSHQEALDYLVHAASRLSGKIRVGGHSKGGNLSVFSATFCGKKLQKRICNVYNFDGPGFELNIQGATEFQEICHCVQRFVPDQSVVGLLLEQDGDYVVVKSHEFGLMQHNLLSWELDGPHFMEVERLADSSVIIDRSVKSWLQEHSSEQREQFVEALYTLFTSSQATTFSELAEQWKKNPAKVLSCLLSVDSQTRKNVIHAMYELFRATHQEIKLDVKNWLQERIQEKITLPAVISDDS